MVACQIEDQVDEKSTNHGDTAVVISRVGLLQDSMPSYNKQNQTESAVKFSSNKLVISNKSEIMEDSRPKNKKKKFKPSNDLYCFIVDGIFTSTKVCNTESTLRPDLDFSDIDDYHVEYELDVQLGRRTCGLDLRSAKKNKLQKVHTQIRDEYYNHSKCLHLAADKKCYLKQRLVRRQKIRNEYVEENIEARKNNVHNKLKKRGVKLRKECILETRTTSNYNNNIHPKRLKFDEEEQRRKEPRRIAKKKQIKENKKQKKSKRVTPFKPATPKQVEFPQYALHEGNISNIVDKKTKELIDLQYRDLTEADLDVLFRLETETVIKKSLDEQLNRDLAVVQKNIADAKALEERIRNDSSRMLELMMQLQFRELSPEDYELLLRLDETVKPKVATYNVINSLKTLEVGPDEEGHCCLICMDDYVKGDILKVLPCKHMYHTGCIEPWLTTSSNKCPLDSIEVL